VIGIDTMNGQPVETYTNAIDMHVSAPSADGSSLRAGFSAGSAVAAGRGYAICAAGSYSAPSSAGGHRPPAPSRADR
jgi:hypothetical protein